MTFKTVSSLFSLAAAAGMVVAPVAASAQDHGPAQGQAEAQTALRGQGQAQSAPGPQAASPPSTAAEDAEAAAALGLPSTISILGKNDPNKRTATAVVNGQVLTGTDIDQRLALLIAANKGQQPSAEELTRLRAQVLRNLIDETLQIQAAKLQKIEVDKGDVDASYARVAAQNFGQDATKMDVYLKSIGVFVGVAQAPDRGRTGVAAAAAPQRPALRQRLERRGQRRAYPSGGLARDRRIPAGRNLLRLDARNRTAGGSQRAQGGRADQGRRQLRRLCAPVFGSLDRGGRRRSGLGAARDAAHRDGQLPRSRCSPTS